MFGKTVSLKALAILCRSLSTLLDSGVTAHRAFQIAGEKAGSAGVRQSTAAIAEELKKGQDITSALEEQQVFPDLLVSMVSVGEQTGALPEILRGLADHYENLLRLRKNFYRAIAWPVIQFVLAVFVIAGLIFLLGWIADSRQTETIDVLGWGLTGTSGALTWLGFVFGSAFTVYLSYRFIKASVVGQKYLDGLLLRIPVLGRCLRSFAIARFAWSYHLTQEAGMPVDESIHSAMRATNNGAFVAAAPLIISAIKQGESVTDALRWTNLFPTDVIEMIHVGETTGTVPETLQRLSPHFEDEARRALETLAGMLGWGVWLAVAAFIIFVVFSIMLWYIGIINEALQGI
ncbi:MAG: type II secretion system F family protein [Planctomycetaceae bacterium]|nr:type II secretion system F family protein [Planctomycetaceae bacterium]